MESVRKARSRTSKRYRLWIAAAALLGPLVATAGIMTTLPDGSRQPPGLGVDHGISDRLGMLEIAEPWLKRGCGSGCWQPYLKLARAAARTGRRLTGEELDARLAEMQARPAPVVLGLARAELRRRIADALAIDSLLDGLDDRTLAVAVFGESRSPRGVVRRKLLFWDAEVGSFEALLLLPAGEGPHPAILGLHGHRDDPEVFAADYLGERLAEVGFAVLMPRLRLHDCSMVENYVARGLLKGGRTLMGLRVYETLLMEKYLRWLDAVDARRVGLLSHSGGSSTANLAVRLSDAFRAHVVDYQVDYRNFCGPLDVHCETVPALVPLAADVNYFAALDVPSLRVPYKFADPELREEIVGFFRRHLGAAGS